MGWKLENTKLPAKLKNLYNIEKWETENKGISDKSEDQEGTDQKPVQKFLKYKLREGNKVHVDTDKSQLISKCSFGVIVSTKIPTNFF